MNWLFYDYETLGTDTYSCPVVAYAGIVIQPERFIDNEYTLTEIRERSHFVKFNVATQIENYGKIPEQETLDWWRENVDPETRKRLLTPCGDDVPITHLDRVFHDTIHGTSLDVVFTRGNTFDPIITQRLVYQLGIPSPYAHWIVRDTRSMLDGLLFGTDVKQKFTPPSLKAEDINPHDPVDDIAMDILRIQVALQAAY